MRAPNVATVNVKWCDIRPNGGANKFCVRLQVRAGIVKHAGVAAAVQPAPYQVDVVINPASNIDDWKKSALRGDIPPLPSTWTDNAWACCTCPDFRLASASPFKHVRTTCWCKHVAEAFYVVALECDQDHSFVYRLSGRNIVPALQAAQVQRSYVDLTAQESDSDSEVEIISQRKNGALFVD